jgi:DNA-binding transcriptional ArsR family regulator
VTAAVSPGHHPRHRIDPLLSAPVRLSIMAALAEVDAIEFGLLRDAVEVSDSVLSKQLSALQAAGFVKIEKGYFGRRPRTWLAISPAGRAALDRHVQALRDLMRSI